MMGVLEAKEGTFSDFSVRRTVAEAFGNSDSLEHAERNSIVANTKTTIGLNGIFFIDYNSKINNSSE